MEKEICIECKENLQISSRHKFCEKCYIIYYRKIKNKASRLSHLKHREERILKLKKYRENNKDIIKKTNQNWYINNKDKKAKLNKDYYQKIKDLKEKYKDEM